MGFPHRDYHGSGSPHIRPEPERRRETEGQDEEKENLKARERMEEILVSERRVKRRKKRVNPKRAETERMAKKRQR